MRYCCYMSVYCLANSCILLALFHIAYIQGNWTWVVFAWMVSQTLVWFSLGACIKWNMGVLWDAATNMSLPSSIITVATTPFWLLRIPADSIDRDIMRHAFWLVPITATLGAVVTYVGFWEILRKKCKDQDYGTITWITSVAACSATQYAFISAVAAIVMWAQNFQFQIRRPSVIELPGGFTAQGHSPDLRAAVLA